MLCSICGDDNTPTAIACRTCGMPLASAAPAPHVLPPGSFLHDQAYSVGKVLGQRGFGITYLGSDTRLRRPVAIKELFPAGCLRQSATVVPAGEWTPATYAEARTQFLHEGQMLGRFTHAGIVQVYAAFEANNTAYLVMEYLRGQTLTEILALRGGRLAEAEALGYLHRVGEALAVVHEAGLLHRDIKPENILVCAEGRVVLVDFGTAREFSAGQTQRHSVTLTPGYAPLEQYAQRAQRGPYTDVYALAATAYHLLTGEVPVAAPDRAAGVELPPVRQLRPQVSPPVAEGVMAGLVMPVTQRPSSVRAWLEGLRNTVPAAQPPPPTARVPPPAPAAPSVENTFEMKMVLIPAGEFQMGSTNGPEDKRPVHTVRLTRPFSLGIYPVTQRQWGAVMGTNPSYFQGDDRPVEQVSWYDAIAFCNALSKREGLLPCYELQSNRREGNSITEATVVWTPGTRGYRLPTEAEWEYAARAGARTAYCFGDDVEQLGQYAWYVDNAGSQTHPVGQKCPNAWGLHDMHGNVLEWVWDWDTVDNYQQCTRTTGFDHRVGHSSPLRFLRWLGGLSGTEVDRVDDAMIEARMTAVDPAGPTATGSNRRVRRGGSWGHHANYCRSAYRHYSTPNYRDGILGFRLLREVS